MDVSDPLDEQPSPDLLDELRKLPEQLAPELRYPWYLLHEPVDEPMPLTRAYSTRTTPFQTRQYLKATDQWRGYAPTIFFREFTNDRDAMCGLLLHEVGHILPQPQKQPEDRDPTAAELEYQIATLVNWNASECLPVDEPWLGHEAPWIRRVLHLHYRALWTGLVLPLMTLGVAGGHFGLSPVQRYYEALGAEPLKLRRWTFKEIEETPAPEEFTQLFASDVAAFKSRRRKEVKQDETTS